MDSVSISARAIDRPPLRGSRRLLVLAGDERLVEQVRRGNDAAFEVVFDRYGARILSFCRHMLGSREEAEDAAQHTFAAAYRQLLRDDREIALKPWLYTIARHRCVSVLRSRRDEAELDEVATDGLSEQVERRAELRELLADIAELPSEQRASLLLAEAGDLSHAEIAAILDCDVPQVKAQVYRARSALIARRDARAMPCEDVREQLATLRGGSLRRAELTLHLKGCHGCRAYREQVKRQRRLLAAALPATPTAGLKAGALGAAGIGGGGAAGGGLMVGGLASGLGGAAGIAKAVAVVGIAAGSAFGVVEATPHEVDRVAVQPPATISSETRPLAAPGPTTTRDGLRAPASDATPRVRGQTGERPVATAPHTPSTNHAPPVEPGVGAPATRDHSPSEPGHGADPAPPGVDPKQVRTGKDPKEVKPNKDQTQVPPGQDPTRSPPGQDPTRVPPGQDPTRVPPGQDPARVPPGHRPTGGQAPGAAPPSQEPKPVAPGQDASRALSGAGNSSASASTSTSSSGSG